MKREKKDKNFLDKPYYEGGSKAMSAFVEKHLTYPKTATDEGVHGTVIIRYTIDYKGRVIETKVLSGIGHGCDEEAERVVKLFQFQVGKYRNIKVQFHKKIKIHFHAKKMKAKPKPVVQTTDKSTQSITYSITKAKKSTKDPKPKTSGGYSYTISIK